VGIGLLVATAAAAPAASAAATTGGSATAAVRTVSAQSSVCGPAPAADWRCFGWFPSEIGCAFRANWGTLFDGWKGVLCRPYNGGYSLFYKN
jgi:hypothetical protein